MTNVKGAMPEMLGEKLLIWAKKTEGKFAKSEGECHPCEGGDLPNTVPEGSLPIFAADSFETACPKEQSCIYMPGMQVKQAGVIGDFVKEHELEIATVLSAVALGLSFLINKKKTVKVIEKVIYEDPSKQISAQYLLDQAIKKLVDKGKVELPSVINNTEALYKNDTMLFSESDTEKIRAAMETVKEFKEAKEKMESTKPEKKGK